MPPAARRHPGMNDKLLAELARAETVEGRLEHRVVELRVALNNLEDHVLEPMQVPECPQEAREVIEALRTSLQATLAALESLL